MSKTAEFSSGETVVWDRLVRVGHWTLVAAFFIAYVTEDDFLTVHTWAGYVACAYVAVRVAWGFIGTRHARFSDFACGPRAAVRYLADLARLRAPRHIGHSPAGAWMVFMLLAAIAATTISGELLLGAKEHSGPFAGLFASSAPAATTPGVTAAPLTAQQARALRSERRKQWGVFEEVHEVLANLTLALVIGHILGVLLASFAHRENLVRAMIHGRKRTE